MERRMTISTPGRRTDPFRRAVRRGTENHCASFKYPLYDRARRFPFGEGNKGGHELLINERHACNDHTGRPAMRTTRQFGAHGLREIKVKKPYRKKIKEG